MGRSDDLAVSEVTPIVLSVCRIAGSRDLVDHARAGLSAVGVIDAVRTHDDAVLFDWLMNAVSYQGIGDAVATGYMDIYGRIDATQIAEGLRRPHSCGKLSAYWAFEGCRYQKGSGTCSEPEHIDACPLPLQMLRNGRLNQTAYSLFMFLRDVAGGDFITWIDERLASVDPGQNPTDRAPRLRQALLEPLGHVYGVSNKVLSMALADLLLAGDPARSLWVETGASMVAVDTLVHNWLHRTGILNRLGCEHPYGERCYGASGCAEIIASISARIDARQFNPAYPVDFPRFVQRAIWWFCAQAGLNECNGNRIDDRFGCARDDCELGSQCDRRAQFSI